MDQAGAAYGMIIVAILGAVAWWNNRKSGLTKLTLAQSRERVRALRAQGYKVRTVRLPDGTRAVLRSRTRG